MLSTLLLAFPPALLLKPKYKKVIIFEMFNLFLFFCKLYLCVIFLEAAKKKKGKKSK